MERRILQEDGGSYLYIGHQLVGNEDYAKSFGMRGLYSQYILNQNLTYRVNVTVAVRHFDYYNTGCAAFATYIANPSTLQFSFCDVGAQQWNYYSGYNNTAGVRMYRNHYCSTVCSGIIGSDTPHITSETIAFTNNVYYTISTVYDLRLKQMTAHLYDANGVWVYTFPVQSYAGSDIQGFDENLRVFLTGSPYGMTGHVSYHGEGDMAIKDVEIAILMREIEPTSIGSYNPQLITKTVTGVIQYLDFPESGEWVAVAAATTSSPVNGYVHHIYVPASGFSTTYTAQTTGNSYDLKAADGCAFSIDAREITIEINRLDGVPVGTYTTGGSLTSVDIAMKNGLWAVAGSTDGKFYVFSKDATSGWYQDHASDSEESVTCVAMSWRGEMVVVGRSDGSVLMYPTGGGTEDDDDDTTDTTFPAQITVFQDGRLAVGKTVVIEKSETSNPYTWTAYATEQTDAQGKVVIPDADNGAFYKLTVDEKETVYAASSTSPQLTISVMTPIINGQWKFDAVYDDDTNIITGSYTDVEPAQSITIRIVNTNTKQLVAQQTVYGNNQLIVTVAGNPEHVYKVDVDAVRFTGNQIRMSKIVHTASIYNIPLGDLDVHMKNAIFTLIIMAVGGLFSYAHSTKGGLLLVALAGGFALFGFTTVSYAMIGIAGFVAIISILIRGTRR